MNVVSGSLCGYSYWVRRTDVGIVTAYVDITGNNFLSRELAGKEIEDADRYLDVHGGCTFLETTSGAEFRDGFVLPAGRLILGWDYGHFDDCSYGRLDFSSAEPCAGFCVSKISEAEAEAEVKSVIAQIIRKYDI